MSSTIIELRQADASSVVSNGNYECTLAKAITIEDGDVVQMKSAFIDAVKSNENLILIEDDLSLQVVNGIYITDWLATNDKTNYTLPDGSLATNQKQLGQDFIPYKQISISDDPSLIVATGYEYFYEIVDDSKPFTITYQYFDYASNPRTFQTTFPAEGGQNTYIDYFNIVMKMGSFQILSPSFDYFAKVGVSPIKLITTPGPVELDMYEPFLFSTNFVVPAGSYSPTDLSLYVSEQLSKNNVGPNKYFKGLINSPFLKVSSNFDAGQNSPDGQKNPDGSPVVLANNAVFIASDLSAAFNFASGKSYYIGSSEIALEFNQDLNKFTFTFLHQPMLDDTGTNISVRYMPYPAIAGQNMAIAKNGGVFFTSLTAKKVKDNSVFDFWEGVLGFDVGNLVASYGQVQNDILGLTGSVMAVNIVDGETTTNGYYGLNSAVQKTSSWYQMPSTDLVSTINNTVSIDASQGISELLNTYSHFILDLNMKFNNEFIGKDVNYNVQSIVSRYYNFGSYAFGDVSGSIQYIHKGAPIVLKAVRCRVLNSDKEVDTELGSDNTIFMQVIKGAMAPPKK